MPWLNGPALAALILIAFGVAAVWDRSVSGSTGGDTNQSRLRIIMGAAVILAGMALLIGASYRVSDLAPIALAVGITGRRRPPGLRPVGDAAGHRSGRGAT